jgi:hypothetical protein
VANKQYATLRNDYEIHADGRTEVEEAADQGGIDAAVAADIVPLDRLPAYIGRKARGACALRGVVFCAGGTQARARGCVRARCRCFKYTRTCSARAIEFPNPNVVILLTQTNVDVLGVVLSLGAPGTVKRRADNSELPRRWVWTSFPGRIGRGKPQLWAPSAGATARAARTRRPKSRPASRSLQGAHRCANGLRRCCAPPPSAVKVAPICNAPLAAT